MKKQAKNITCYIGFAYLALAFFSLVTTLSIRVVNCISMGALCISVAELIISISKLKRKSRSLIKTDDLKNSSSKLDLAILYFKKSIEKKTTETPSRRVVILLVSLLYSFSFIIIIAYANIDTYAFLEKSEVGTFCTVASLGIILLSRYIAEWQEEREEWDNESDFFDGLNYFLEELSEAMGKSTGKQSGVEQAMSKPLFSNEKDRIKEKRSKSNKAKKKG